MRIPPDFLLLAVLSNYMFNLIRADPETSRAATSEEEERHWLRFIQGGTLEEDEIFWSRVVQEISSLSIASPYPTVSVAPSTSPSTGPSTSPSSSPTSECLVDVSLIATSYLIAFRILWTNDLMILRSRSTALLQVVFLVQS